MQRLPEIFIAEIISLTTPLDACRLAAVSTMWRTAADSDVVWERFLPSDYKNILARAAKPVEYSSMKELFFRLCDSILIDSGGSKSFSLTRSNGKISLFLSSMALELHEGEEFKKEWKRIHTAELSSEVWSELELDGEPPAPFRFPEVALLNSSSSIEIVGEVVCNLLTTYTYYAIRLIFRITSNCLGLHFPLKAAIEQRYIICYKRVCLDSGISRQCRRGDLRPSASMGIFPSCEDPVFCVEVAGIREDGWMELEIGRFFTDYGKCEKDEEVSFWVAEETRRERGGLLLEGIELYPLN